MMSVYFCFGVLFWMVIEACSKNDSSNLQSQSFFWSKGIPRYKDVNNQVCDLLPSTLYTYDLGQSTKSQYNVLSFGDSYEMRFCEARPSGVDGNAFSSVKRMNSKNIYAECTYQNESISYKVRRMFGQNGGNTEEAWEHANSTSISIFKEMSVYAANGMLSVKHSRSAAKSVVDAVVHGSFLWDLKHAHADWCRAQHDKLHSNSSSSFSSTHATPSASSVADTNLNRRIFDSVCNRVQKSHDATIPVRPMDVANTELLLQSWERLTMPWCDAAMLHQWQETFLREVHALLDSFPDAALFLRTQPISSAVFLGNFRCHKPMNDFIVHVARSFQQSEKDSEEGVGNSNININSNNSNSDSNGNSGSVISSNSSESDKIVQKRRGRVVRLIDLYSLFATPNDNGVDHFHKDSIHLTEAGFKIYRGVILRVLADYFKYN